ncbi:MAG: hypothetical protein OXS32_07730 [Verrucomicrobiales bacterium]|nr:hypothetical protein [Verrucomicrobiales bacterium]
MSPRQTCYVYPVIDQQFRCHADACIDSYAESQRKHSVKLRAQHNEATEAVRTMNNTDRHLE